MGKGDKPRPLSVDKETYGERWEKAFGKEPRRHGRKKPAEPEQPKQEETT